LLQSRLIGPAVVLLLTIAFYWKLVLTDQYVWFDHPDMTYIELPRLQFQAAEIHKRHFPLWDPHIWCGQPLIGQTQPGPLFPLNLLFYLLPLRDGYLRVDCLNWLYVAIRFLAALLGYRLCRELGAGLAAAVLAGCAFSFGGFLGTAPWLDVFNGAIWTPLIALYVLRVVRGQRPAASAALSGLYLGIAWLSGHHEIPLLVSCAVAGTWLFFGLRDHRLLRWALLCFVIAGLVSAVQVWPTYEFGQLSKRWVGSESPVGWKDKVPYTIHTIYSLPAKGILETVLPSHATYADASPMLGIAVVVLAVLGIVARWSDRRTRWLVLLALVSVIYAMGAFAPLHGVMYSVSPLLAKARIPVRALHLYHFALAMLAGLGLECLLRRQSEQWARRLSFAAGSFGILILGTASAMAVAGRELDDRILVAGFCGCAVGAVIAAWRHQWIGPGMCATVMLGVMLTDLTNLGPRNFSHVREQNQLKFAGTLFRNRDVADFLRAQPGSIRVAVNDKDVPENFGDWHLINMLQGYVAGVPDNLTGAGLHTRRSRELFSVTHSIGRAPDHPEQVELFTGASGVKVFRYPNPMPRAWTIHEVTVAKDAAQMGDLIQGADLDFRKRAVMLGNAPSLEVCPEQDDIRIVRRGTDRVTIETKMACRGMVILADSFYPGWRVKIDGKQSEVLEVFGALRGIVVDGGAHTVDMIYRPLSILGGAGLTLIGLVAVSLIVRFCNRRPK